MKKWLKITLITEPVLVDAITDFLIGVIDAGVETGVDEHIHLKTINAYVNRENPSLDEMKAVVALVAGHVRELADIFAVEAPELSWTVIEEEDWGKNWKKHFYPFAIVPGLVISPSWEKYQPQPDEKVLVLDPGMAFGTGHHATTALALRMLRREIDRRELPSVLDVGTGTGILGMAAALLGAQRVVGIDNDPLAVAIARENIAINDLDRVMTAEETPLAEVQEAYALVFANIIHEVLVELAPDLRRVTLNGGMLILAGILQDQAEDLISLYQGLGFRLDSREDRDEWVALLFGKPA